MITSADNPRHIINTGCASISRPTSSFIYYRTHTSEVSTNSSEVVRTWAYHRRYVAVDQLNKTNFVYGGQITEPSKWNITALMYHIEQLLD